MQLSPNFSLNELVTSNTAIANRIGNMPSSYQTESLRHLAVNLLQPLRDGINMPIHVNSGFRSHQLNELIGGAESSQHMKGEAADLTCADNTQLFSYVRDNLEFDQLIWEMGDEFEPEWVHVSLTRGENRNQVLRAKRTNKGTKYEKF